MNDSRNATGTGVVLQAEKLVKSYDEGNNELEVLSGVDLTVTQGDILAIIGTSGSGKSTLLNLLGAWIGQPVAVSPLLAMRWRP